MPTYEYRCNACGQHLEVVQSFTDSSLTTCGACGGDLRKVFSAVGIVFKGSGFYKTDNRGGANGTTREKKESASTGSSSDKSSSDKGSSSTTPEKKSSDTKAAGSKIA